MLRAWRDVLTHDDTFSAALSPEEVWLTAFHDYVAEEAPRAAFQDGTVDEARFYSLLERFLEAQVLLSFLTSLEGTNKLLCCSLKIQSHPCTGNALQVVACQTSASSASRDVAACCMQVRACHCTTPHAPA